MSAKDLFCVVPEGTLILFKCLPRTPLRCVLGYHRCVPLRGTGVLVASNSFLNLTCAGAEASL